MKNKTQGINGKKETLEGKVKKYNRTDFEIPVLFYNSKKSDQEAYFALMDSGIPCIFNAPSEEPTPMLLVEFTHYDGLEEIMEYIRSKGAQKLKEKYK